MKNKEKQKFTFSKWIVMIILIISLIDMQIPFILAFMGKEQIADTLAITIVTEVVAVFAVYSVKAFFETKEQEKNRIKERELDSDLNFIDINEERKG